MAPLRLNLLGSFAAEAGAEQAAILGKAPKKVRALLAYLALNPGVAHPRQKLAALLWEESGESQARQSLRQALADLRQALSRDHDGLICSNETVTLRTGSIDVDVFELERACASGGAEALDRAVALYRGDLLEGLDTRAPAFDDWLALERSRLREQALNAMTRLLEDLCATGAIESGLRVALRVLTLDPLRESAHRALMQLYAKQARYGSALKQYQTCRRVLKRELGVEPEPATRALHAELMQARARMEPHGEESASPSTPDAAPAGLTAAGSNSERQAAASGAELAPVTIVNVKLGGFAALTKRLDPEALGNPSMLTMPLSTAKRLATKA
jgi:DNA-binding SARP family transcriptional activator